MKILAGWRNDSSGGKDTKAIIVTAIYLHKIGVRWKKKQSYRLSTEDALV